MVFKQKRKGMFLKLFSTYIAILFISFIFIGLVVNALLQNEFINRYHDTFDHHREQILYYFDLAHNENWDKKMFSSSLELNMNQEDRMIFLFDHQGDIKFNSKLFDEFNIDPEVINLALSGKKISERLHNNDRVVYLMSEPIEIPSEIQTHHTMVMVFHEFDKEAKRLRSILNITILIAIIIAGIIIFFTSRKMTSPLREMNERVLQFAKGDFSHRVRVRTNDEIGQLGETFNYMAKELASIDQMRKDFVANVSHDLRSPLTSIKGFLGALMDGTIPPEEQQKYFGIMKNETERLMKLVEDLLDMARLESGQTEVNRVSYNISEQIRLVAAKMEPVISKYKIDIEFLEEDDDIFVIADPFRMEQVFINLLQNAIHFSSPNSRIEVTINRKANDAVISIRDYGLGINEEDLKYIWDRFYKKEKARSNKGGTGIGLSIVKHIIDLHETSIHVSSELGKGTLFTFSLPITNEER